MAMALIRPLAWELAYAVGVALEKAKRQKKKIRGRKSSQGPQIDQGNFPRNELGRRIK